MKWCKITFSDVFAAWAHLKAMRCFVEAVLRYGLPVDFCPLLIKPRRGFERPLRASLNVLYSKLAGDVSLTGELDTNETDISGVGNDFFPYVYMPISLLEM